MTPNNNRPSNHTSEVDEALGETITIRATTRRPQTKGHVEGAFGLFQQAAPDLVLHGDDPRERARQLAWQVLVTWACTVNHRPRKSRGGKSRVDIIRETPVSNEQLDHARQDLHERPLRQE